MCIMSRLPRKLERSLRARSLSSTSGCLADSRGMAWPHSDKRPFSRMAPVECAARGGPAKSACSRCKNAAYCSPACQKSHWAEHRRDCAAMAAARAGPPPGTPGVLPEPDRAIFREITVVAQAAAAEFGTDEVRGETDRILALRSRNALMYSNFYRSARLGDDRGVLFGVRYHFDRLRKKGRNAEAQACFARGRDGASLPR
ncbi:hypothetical protein DFJ74DRAFT_375158 [Hyaloraphidium curvatum]|nr:hypothetical protein DFJ74DRAFT_375158 [Hyaloraphidium curvatum]